MKILYSPQRSDKKIRYVFKDDIITVNLNESLEVFDFTGMPDGRLYNIETILEINPIISAKKENGILSVELLNYISVDSTEEERFPTWIEV